MPSRWAARMICSHSSEVVFLGEMILRTRSTRISAPPPGSESRPASRSRESVSDERQLGLAGDVLDLARRERVQVDRVAGLDRPEQILVPLDAEVGVVAALHEDGGAAERQRLLDLLEDDGLGQRVALAGVARPAVERAELAVGVTDVGVVQVAVDDERDHAGLGRAVAQLVRDPADGHQVARAQERAGLVVARCARRRARARAPRPPPTCRTPRPSARLHRGRARRTAARAPRRARRPGGPARRTASRPAARAGRSGSAASRSSGPGTRPASRTPRPPCAPAPRAPTGPAPASAGARARARPGPRRRPRGRPTRRTPSAGRCAPATAGPGRGAGSDPRRRCAARRRRSACARRPARPAAPARRRRAAPWSARPRWRSRA